jgi:hypothetical protein
MLSNFPFQKVWRLFLRQQAKYAQTGFRKLLAKWPPTVYTNLVATRLRVSHVVLRLLLVHVRSHTESARARIDQEAKRQGPKTAAATSDSVI